MQITFEVEDNIFKKLEIEAKANQCNTVGEFVKKIMELAVMTITVNIDEPDKIRELKEMRDDSILGQAYNKTFRTG
ncbi:MAG: hypothetical protein WC364_14975 [Eubacteriales bacterium]|jgi:hypothetical protein